LAQAAIPEQSANQITGLEIVPWQPVGSAVALHILADFINFRQRARRVQPEVHTESQGSGSQEMISMGLASFGTEFDFENPTIQHSSTKPSWSGVSSSSTVHRPHSRTPLVDSSVRRSPRIRGDQGGFKHVHLGKRQRREVALLPIPNADGNANPIPTSMLRSWGINCGVPPSELTDEALMETPGSVNLKPVQDE